MKKISILFASVVAMLSFNSCSETWDDNPTLYGVPENATFTLNKPTMADNLVLLDQGGTLHLTCNQPDYGYQAPACYEVQASLTQDFTKYETLGTVLYNRAEINPPCDEVANAACKLLGVVDEVDVPTTPISLWIRLRAYIDQSPENTTCYSNAVEYKQVQVYYNISVPGLQTGLYLRGDMNGWGVTDEFLTTDEMGIYELDNITITKGQTFKIADADWGPVNLGAGSAELKLNEPYTLNGGDNPGNLSCPDDFTGKLKLELRAGKYHLTLITSEEQK